METERESQPTCMYKNGPFGKEVSQIFDHPDEIPEGEGWVDSPAKLEKPKKAPAKKPAAKRAKKAPAKKPDGAADAG